LEELTETREEWVMKRNGLVKTTFAKEDPFIDTIWRKRFPEEERREKETVPEGEMRKEEERREREAEIEKREEVQAILLGMEKIRKEKEERSVVMMEGEEGREGEK
jgi:hypothetical protein